MGLLKITNWLGGLVLVAVLGGLAVTNPRQAAYEDYATRRLTTYLESTVCMDIPETLGEQLREQCATLLQSNRAQIRQIIANNTTTANFLLFSQFRTELAVPEMTLLPAYEFETIGIFHQFITYRAERS